MDLEIVIYVYHFYLKIFLFTFSVHHRLLSYIKFPVCHYLDIMLFNLVNNLYDFLNYMDIKEQYIKFSLKVENDNTLLFLDILATHMKH